MTQEIARDFLQCVAFVDDNAYSENGEDHPFDSKAVQKAFANSDLLCSVNHPESPIEAAGYKKILSKADVIFLDWQMFKDAPKTSGADEDDAAVIEKGEITLNLLESLFKQKEETKLIFIYTGDNDFEGICEKINSTCKGITRVEESFDLAYKKFKVKLVGKKASGNLFNTKAVVKDYFELPELVLQEFENLNQEILPTYSVLALTQIRKNSGNIISHFDQKMDGAFFNHRILIGDHDEAIDHLSEAFSTAISSLVESTVISKKLSESLVNSKIIESLNGKIVDLGKIDSVNIGRINLSEDLINKWLKHSFPASDFKDKEIDKRKLLDKIGLEITKLIHTDYENNDERFAHFTQHRPEFLNFEFTPTLTLGTIIKNEKKYYLCIQPKCDTLSRRNGSELKFIFLELIPSNGKFEIILNDSDFSRFKVEYKPFNILTFSFRTSSGMGYVESIKIDDSAFQFQDIQGQIFIWKGTLSESQSQRISNKFASQISRVGLNESEWLRRNSPNQ